MIHDNQYMEKKKKKRCCQSLFITRVLQKVMGAMKEKKLKGLQGNVSIEVNYCLLNSADKENDTFQTHISL